MAAQEEFDFDNMIMLETNDILEKKLKENKILLKNIRGTITNEEDNLIKETKKSEIKMFKKTKQLLLNIVNNIEKLKIQETDLVKIIGELENKIIINTKLDKDKDDDLSDDNIDGEFGMNKYYSKYIKYKKKYLELKYKQ